MCQMLLRDESLYYTTTSHHREVDKAGWHTWVYLLHATQVLYFCWMYMLLKCLVIKNSKYTLDTLL